MDFLCFQISDFGIQQQVSRGPEKNKQPNVLSLFSPPVVTFQPCCVKRSVNDEKWWDCFVAIISSKISASGEVEASQNMAE